MPEIHINWLALILAIVARMLVGMIWYSQIAFGPSFMRLSGCTPDELRARLPMALLSDLVGALIMAVVLAHAVTYAGATNWVAGVTVGLLNWLGFVTVTHFALVMYEKRPFGLFLVNNGYQALTLAIMGAILGVWR